MHLVKARAIWESFRIIWYASICWVCVCVFESACVTMHEQHIKFYSLLQYFFVLFCVCVRWLLSSRAYLPTPIRSRRVCVLTKYRPHIVPLPNVTRMCGARVRPAMHTNPHAAHCIKPKVISTRIPNENSSTSSSSSYVLLFGAMFLRRYIAECCNMDMQGWCVVFFLSVPLMVIRPICFIYS